MLPNTSRGLPASTPWFETLQAGILKSHGRDHHALIVASLGEPAAARPFLAALPVTSFAAQLRASEARRRGEPTSAVLAVWLTADGYTRLGFAPDELPRDESFRAGMPAAGPRLGDPPVDTWDAHFRSDVHAVLALADDDEERLTARCAEIAGQLGEAGGAVLAVERGCITRGEAHSVEHFGFADGLSNPRFLEEERVAGDEPRFFDDRAPPSLALAEDPLRPGAYGSYVVLRKLEQDVLEFHRTEALIADALELTGEDRERAGAMVVGRFRDGTPLVRAPRPGSGRSNDFDYREDPAGARCPFQAHARKMNARGDDLRRGAWGGEGARRRLVRRGFAYGGRPGEVEARSTGLGLMFVSFSSSVREQFEHLQATFAGDPDYFERGTGTDALLGARDGAPSRWPSVWGEPGGAKVALRELVRLKGGAYLFAPSVAFLRELADGAPGPERREHGSTARVAALREALVERAFGDRSREWLTPDEVGHVLERRPELGDAPVIVRKAHACRQMLEAMVDPARSHETRLFEIEPGECIVGRIPLGSVGLGKVFPGYLTEEEQRVASFCNRDEPSVFGHTVPNFSRVLSQGLAFFVDDARSRAADATLDEESRAFYEAVAICSEAVIAYANSFADRASALAHAEPDAARARELEAIAEVCRRVPAEPARSFHEALQCVWFVHLAQSAFCAFNSLGRLDRTLAPYLEDDLDRGRALELVECFLIKGAERLHLNPATLLAADHLSYGTGIGTSPIYLDQVASSNNFIQNIMVGGTDAEGADATNEVTYLFLEANGGVALCTPTLDVRVHEGSPPRLLEAIDASFRRAETGLPILYNDASVVPGLISSGLPAELARDYACAGCWEPVLNGQGTFIFGMVNMLVVLEGVLNGGRRLSNGAMFLKGQKAGPRAPETYASFDEVRDEFRRQLGFFTDKVALGSAAFYLLPGEVTPTPFLSLLLDGCYERGLDQSRGGADENLAGCLAFAMPNAINALANLERFVFTEARFSLEEVVDALRWNFGVGPVRSEYEPREGPDGERVARMQEIRRVFAAAPKWGNRAPEVEAIAEWVSTVWYEACERAAELARRSFLAAPGDPEARKLRGMANYQGPGLREAVGARRGSDLSLVFTHGSGTFGQYSSMGLGVAASADGRGANEPIAPNCSPPGGTAREGLEALFESLGRLQLARYGCGVVTDIRVDGTTQRDGFFAELTRRWADEGGSILTVSCLSTAELDEMYRLGERVRSGELDAEVLRPFCDRMCRVGGWNSAYICLPRGQQQDHLLRASW